MRLVTKRLILRRPTLKDVKAITENANNLNVTKYISRMPYPYSIKDAKSYIKFCKKLKQNHYEFSIKLKSSGKLAGIISLMNIDKFGKKAEIGCWLGQRYWRQGIGAESAKAIMKFALNKLKLIRLEANVCCENQVSKNLWRKLGFKKEGTKRHALRSRATGRWHDTCIYGFLKSDTKL
jgi:RimJ/RimL family protein N-acetyltransferase